MEAPSDDKQVWSMKVLRIFIRQGWDVYSLTRRSHSTRESQRKGANFADSSSRRCFCAYGQFQVSQWSQDDRWTWQSEAWPRCAPTLFARPESGRLFVIRHVEASNQGSGASYSWRNRECFHEVWSQVTSEDLQSVFLNWTEQFEYVIEHDGEYYLNLH
jgi:hypothetical protein